MTERCGWRTRKAAGSRRKREREIENRRFSICDFRFVISRLSSLLPSIFADCLSPGPLHASAIQARQLAARRLPAQILP